MLSHAGANLGELLDDLPSTPRISPAEAMVDAAERDPNYQVWKRQPAEAEPR